MLDSILALITDFIEDIESSDDDDTVTTSRRSDIFENMPSWQFLFAFLVFGFLTGFSFGSMLNSQSSREFDSNGGSRTLGNSLYYDDS